MYTKSITPSIQNSPKNNTTKNTMRCSPFLVRRRTDNLTRISQIQPTTGRRSKIASESLSKLGYTNVKEFGGIIDWPYEIVK